MSQTWLDVHVLLVIVVLVHAHAEAESNKIGNGRNVESLIKIKDSSSKNLLGLYQYTSSLATQKRRQIAVSMRSHN